MYSVTPSSDCVSVVIATLGRASLKESVKSIAAQKDCETEIIVVLDDPNRREYVRSLLDGFSYVLLTVDRVGAAAARNVGLKRATGAFIGYLDDDDLWLPEKCARQIEAINRSLFPEKTFSVATSRFIRENGEESRSRLRPFNSSKETFANFVVSRPSVRFGSVQFNTPALLGRADLMRSLEWDESLRKHQDWDLLVRLWEIPDVQCAVIETTLVVVHQGSRGSISKLQDWRHGERWLMKHNDRVTGRSRADFVTLHLFLHAVRGRSLKGIARSLRLTWPNIPHVGAAIRCAAGIFLGR